MKRLLLILALCFAFAGAAIAAPLDLTLTTTVDASHYLAGATAVKTIRVLSIDYQNGVVRFELLDASGNAYGSGAVCGVNSATITEATAQAVILAAISS